MTVRSPTRTSEIMSEAVACAHKQLQNTSRTHFSAVAAQDITQSLRCSYRSGHHALTLVQLSLRTSRNHFSAVIAQDITQSLRCSYHSGHHAMTSAQLPLRTSRTHFGAVIAQGIIHSLQRSYHSKDYTLTSVQPLVMTLQIHSCTDKVRIDAFQRPESPTTIAQSQHQSADDHDVSSPVRRTLSPSLRLSLQMIAKHRTIAFWHILDKEMFSSGRYVAISD